MPAPERNRLNTWYVLIKEEWLPAQVTRVKAWISAAREEPALVWQTPQVRYAVMGVGALVAVWILIFLFSLLEPPGAKNAQPRAKTATFHVVCGNRDCGHHFLIERKFGFDDFPVECPKCGQETARHAMRCHSEDCGGRYVIAQEEDGQLRCAECGASLGPAP